MKNTNQKIKNNFTLKKLMPIIIIMLIFSLFTACSGSSGSSSGDLEPDTWYTYKEIDILKVQNCLISSAHISSNGKGVTATYIPVCKECHEHGTSWMAAPEVNYPVSKIYSCDKCGAKTTLKFKIQY